MNLDNIKVGNVYKNYKELCAALDEKVKTGNSKKYQIIDWDRYFQYEKKGNKFVITNVYEEIKDKTIKRGGNNRLPFINEMEILLIDLLLRHSEKEMTLSNTKLMLELCMVNSNYHKYFTDRNRLSKLLDMEVGYIIDFYDATNSTFKSAISTITKSLESQRLIMHEIVTMVTFVDTSIQVTPTGHAKVNDVFSHNELNDTYVNKNVKPSEIYREATTEERECIIKIERHILKNKYKVDNIQDIFLSGQANNYYKDVYKMTLEHLNIKKAHKANRYTCNLDELALQQVKLLQQWELSDIKDITNIKVMARFDYKNNDRYEKAIAKLFEDDNIRGKQAYRIENDYVDNLNTLSNTLIDIHNDDSIKDDKEVIDCDSLLN